MNLDHIRETLPQYIMGSLSAQDALATSRALAANPELLVDLRLAVHLHDAFERELEPPPPFPESIYHEARSPRSLVPKPLTDSLQLLRQTADITGNAIKLALKLI